MSFEKNPHKKIIPIKFIKEIIKENTKNQEKFIVEL